MTYNCRDYGEVVDKKDSKKLVQELIDANNKGLLLPPITVMGNNAMPDGLYLSATTAMHKYAQHDKEETREAWELANKKANGLDFDGDCLSYTIKKVIVNPPATIILWNDGTKTIAKHSPTDEKPFDPEKGVLICFFKKIFPYAPNRLVSSFMAKGDYAYDEYKESKKLALEEKEQKSSFVKVLDKIGLTASTIMGVPDETD